MEQASESGDDIRLLVLVRNIRRVDVYIMSEIGQISILVAKRGWGAIPRTPGSSWVMYLKDELDRNFDTIIVRFLLALNRELGRGGD